MTRPVIFTLTALDTALNVGEIFTIQTAPTLERGHERSHQTALLAVWMAQLQNFLGPNAADVFTWIFDMRSGPSRVGADVYMPRTKCVYIVVKT